MGYVFYLHTHTGVGIEISACLLLPPYYDSWLRNSITGPNNLILCSSKVYTFSGCTDQLEEDGNVLA